MWNFNSALRKHGFFNVNILCKWQHVFHPALVGGTMNSPPSCCPWFRPWMTKFTQNWIISFFCFFTKLGSEEPVKVAERNFQGISSFPKHGQNGLKVVFCIIFWKTYHWFSLETIWNKKSYCYLYFTSNSLQSYATKCSQPVRLQDSSNFNIWRKKKEIKFTFCS